MENKDSWKCKPSSDRKVKLYTKIREVLQRKAAVARPLSYTFTKVNQIVRGWINYFRIGSMKKFMKEFGQWLRPQDTCSHNQAVEKANESLYESAENQQEIQMQFHRRRYIQGGKHKTWTISTMWIECNQLYHQSKSAGHTKSGKTRFSQSAGILSKIVVILIQM